MWVHPSSSPCINLNLASVSYLKIVFKSRVCDEFCQEILKERTKQKFLSIADMEKFILAKKQKMDIDIRDDHSEHIVFS